MNLKLDENLPAALVGDLAELGHDVDTVPQEALQGRPDEEVFRAAQEAGRFLITQDLVFSDVRAFTPGMHHGLALVRLRTPGRSALRSRVRAVFATEEVGTWAGCFVVVTERKVRVRRPAD